MRLLYLHGAPASGKLTIAHAFCNLTGARLFDNHIAIDVARTVFDFGAPGFWSLVKDIRHAVFKAAAGQKVPMLVTTACYAPSDDAATFAELERHLAELGARVDPVYLTCSLAEREKRVIGQDRAARGKITSAKGLQTFDQRYQTGPVERANCLTIDAEKLTAEAAAHEIAAQLSVDLSA